MGGMGASRKRFLWTVAGLALLDGLLVAVHFIFFLLKQGRRSSVMGVPYALNIVDFHWPLAGAMERAIATLASESWKLPGCQGRQRR